MTLENYLAEAGALAGLAGVLAGLSLAAVIQFLATANGSRLVTAGIVVYSVALGNVPIFTHCGRVIFFRRGRIEQST